MSEEIKPKKINPKFFFLSLALIIALITTVATTLNLFFEVLNNKLPDILTATYTYGYDSYTFSSIRSSLAILIIIFPMLCIINYYWRNYIRKGLANTENILLKWSTYLILFLAIITIAVDLITLVNYFIAGEITLRFIYKVLATLIVAGMVLLYYHLNLKMFLNGEIKVARRITPKSGLAIVSIVIFFALIIFTFQVIGSPLNQRLQRLDSRRVNDLQSIQMSIINYWQQKGNLPTNLETLKDPTTYYNIPKDPEFQIGKKYEYIITGDKSFELCAEFSTKMSEGYVEGGEIYAPQYAKDIATSYSLNSQNESWQHGEGRTCFARNIDPDIYKPVKE